MANVLVIDDDEDITRLLQTQLTEEGHRVTIAHQGDEGMAKAFKMTPDLIMLDVFLPDSTGYQICSQIRNNASTQSVPIIMMTGAARFPNQQKFGLERGANEYICKPFNVIEVDTLIHKYLDANRVVPPSAVSQQKTPPVTPESSSDLEALSAFLEQSLARKKAEQAESLEPAEPAPTPTPSEAVGNGVFKISFMVSPDAARNVILPDLPVQKPLPEKPVVPSSTSSTAPQPPSPVIPNALTFDQLGISTPCPPSQIPEGLFNQLLQQPEQPANPMINLDPLPPKAMQPDLPQPKAIYPVPQPRPKVQVPEPEQVQPQIQPQSQPKLQPQPQPKRPAASTPEPLEAFSPGVLASKERYIDFSMEIYALATRLCGSQAEKYLADQLLRTGFAVGRQLTESRMAVTKDEFMALLQGAQKDLRETGYWLMITQKAGLLKELNQSELEKTCQSLNTLLTDFVRTQSYR